MNIKLLPNLEADVIALVEEYGYEPSELISVGLGYVGLFLKERAKGNSMVVLSDSGRILIDFKMPPAENIDKIAKALLATVEAS